MQALLWELFLSLYQPYYVDFSLSFCSTFFKKFHKGLARTIRCLLKEDGPSEAILFSPKRGDSLDKFLVEVEASGLHCTITEMYDAEIWRRHINFTNGDPSLDSYESDHCYPLLISITRWNFPFLSFFYFLCCFRRRTLWLFLHRTIYPCESYDIVKR